MHCEFMFEKTPKQKDYIDEYDEWQRHQFEPGYFTGGRVPVWIKYPGNRKRLGAIFLIMGLIYGGWAVYNVMVLNEVMSVVFVGLAAIVFMLAGVKLVRKVKK